MQITSEDAKRILKARIASDPLNYPLKWPSHNPAQVKAINIISNGDPINILTFGNGTGKTHVLISMWSAIMFGTKNPLFQKGIFVNWPKQWPKRARICAPESLLGDRDVIQLLMHKLFPKGRWKQEKNHKAIYSTGETDTGWTWDVMTYDQVALQATGETKGLILYSEPPPKPLFNENIARLRAGGMIIAEMTPLNMASWIFDDYIDIGVLTNDEGKVIGKINHIEGSIWDNCDEKPGGQLSRRAIELILAQYPTDEREMRANGTPGRLQGKIYKDFKTDVHVINELDDYHKKCFKAGKYTIYQVIDPHDRKPFAVGWYAVFPDEKIVCMAEFPDTAYKPFHQFTSFNWAPENYAEYFKKFEQNLFGPKAATIIRFIDPNFGQSIKVDTKKSVRQTFFEWGQMHNYDLNYALPNDAIEDGHLAVKSFLGNSELKLVPKLFFMASCKNHIYGMSHYAYKENKNLQKGLSEKPELVYKDFPDLVRYLCIMNPVYREEVKRSSAPILWQRAKYPGR